MRMILAGDIGGTKTRFALYAYERGSFVRKQVQRYESNSAPSLQDLIRRFLKEYPAEVSAACLGIPGPVQQGHVKVTNLPWEFSEGELQRELSIARVLLVNDLVSYTAAIPFLNHDDIEVIHAGSAQRDKNLSCVLAPGTGLGMGFLHQINGVGFPIASEGGHANFAPNSPLEIELLQFLKREFPLSVSWERLLCGPGLLNMYRFLKERGETKESPEVAIRLKNEAPAAVISTLGLEKKDALCEQTLDLFVSVLGSHASNLVLTFLATGGVYLGGGIPPKIVGKLLDGSFVRAYLNKQRLVEVIEKTPVYVIKDDHAALLGAAFLAYREMQPRT